jgi:ribosomal protein S19
MATSARKLSESKVKEGIRKVLTEFHAWHYMPVQTGMGVGGIHDHIACLPVVVTQEMVGKTIGCFVSVEAKEQGVVAELYDLNERGLDAHAHLAKDGVFISNRALQAYQADGIHEACGKAFVADNPATFRNALVSWIEGVQHHVG